MANIQRGNTSVDLEDLSTPMPMKHQTFSGDRLVSDAMRDIFSIVNIVVLSNAVALCGIFANLINIRVFLRLGFTDTINISFFSMALADLLLQVMTVVVGLAFNPWIAKADVRWLNKDLLFILAGWVHAITIKITAFITAFVAFERCLCIAMPLKVKTALTPGRTVAINAFIFLLSTVSVLPVFSTISIGTTYDPARNKTLLYAIVQMDKFALFSIMSYLNNVAYTLFAYIAVFICTLVLVVNIHRSSRWRSQFSTTKENSNKNSRERTAMKMTLTIAVVFFGFYTPNVCLFVAMAENENLNLRMHLHNLFILISSFIFLFESINSSLNIFIYLKMSSKYREAFKLLMCKSNQ